MSVGNKDMNAVIQKALDHWRLGDASVALVAARENQVYRVQADARLFALRLHRQGYRTVAEIRSELMWMSMLEENDVDVPKPIISADGDSIKIVDDVVVDMLSWIEGQPLKQLEPTEDIYHDLGVLMARMHELADAWSLPESFERPKWDLVGDEPTWGRFWENPGLTDAQQAKLLDFRESARTALGNLQQPDQGLIHADLVPDNMLCSGGKLQPIDFDDGGFGYRLFDIATVTHRSRRLKGKGALANAVTAGYQKQRSLDCQSLPLFEALRACTYVGWNITRIDEPDGTQRNQRFIAEAEAAINRYFESEPAGGQS